MTTTYEHGRLAPDDAASTARGPPRRRRRRRRRRGGRLRRAAGLALLGAVAWTLVRPRLLNWGATRAEVEAALPGDDLLPDPDAASTMAVDVDAPPDAVWPWLRQLGQDRGGFYSYELAENLVGLDIHNADRVVPAWQALEVGAPVRLGTAERFPDATLEVAALAPERSLVLRTPDDPTGWVWAFVLEPMTGERTRLLVRSRIRLPANPVVRAAARAVLDPVSALMTHGMLRGIRSRAERLAAERAASTGTDVDGSG